MNRRGFVRSALLAVALSTVSPALPARLLRLREVHTYSLSYWLPDARSVDGDMLWKQVIHIFTCELDHPHVGGPEVLEKTNAILKTAGRTEFYNLCCEWLQPLPDRIEEGHIDLARVLADAGTTMMEFRR